MRDEMPASPQPPFGATVIIFRRKIYRRSQNEGGSYEFLILHRSHAGARYEGDWAWTPPSGMRLENEPIDQCAARELWEKTGLMRVNLQPSPFSSADWVVFLGEVNAEATLRMSLEHDRCEWVTVTEAARRCQPEIVAQPFRQIAEMISANPDADLYGMTGGQGYNSSL